MRRLLALSLLVSSGSVMANTDFEQQLKPYPEAKSGMTRHVIQLTPEQNEDLLKVEIIPGKTLEVDCNIHFFGGRMEEKIIDGWGYNYYELSEIKGPASTLMACLPNSKKNAFVRVNTDLDLVRYNSKLPIVVYTPTDVELHYRIWRTEEQTTQAYTLEQLQLQKEK